LRNEFQYRASSGGFTAAGRRDVEGNLPSPPLSPWRLPFSDPADPAELEMNVRESHRRADAAFVHPFYLALIQYLQAVECGRRWFGDSFHGRSSASVQGEALWAHDMSQSWREVLARAPGVSALEVMRSSETESERLCGQFTAVYWPILLFLVDGLEYPDSVWFHTGLAYSRISLQKAKRLLSVLSGVYGGTASDPDPRIASWGLHHQLEERVVPDLMADARAASPNERVGMFYDWGRRAARALDHSISELGQIPATEDEYRSRYGCELNVWTADEMDHQLRTSAPSAESEVLGKLFLDSFMTEAGLTPRQADVVHLLWQGLTTDKIACELGVAPQTVLNLKAKACMKLRTAAKRLDAR
jgi:DNA-binding CsgD family transcriptional regulator